MENIGNDNVKNLYISSFLFGIKDRLIASFFMVFLLRLDATNLQISLYQILTASVGGLTLLFITSYVDNSKKAFLKSILFDRFGFLIFSILLVFVKDTMFIIILFSVYSVAFSVSGLLSPNYIKESIPKERWGRVFCNNKIVLVVSGILALILIGRFLDVYSYIFPYNFSIVFIICAIFYIISFHYIRNIKADIKVSEDKANRIDIIKNIDLDMFLMVFVYSPIFMITPIWSIYHVSILGFSNFQIGMLSVMYFIGGLTVLPYWGTLLDKYCNKKLFKIVSCMMAIIPIIYILNNSYYYLLGVQFIMGIIANGFDVILQNNLMSNAQKSKFDFAYFSNFEIYQSLNRVIFPALGIYIYSKVGIIPIFLIGGTFRIVVALIAIYKMSDNSLVTEEAIVVPKE